MPLRFDPEWLEEGNRAFRRQLSQANVPPRLANLAAAVGTSEISVLNWNGIYLRVPPVPYTPGLRLEALRLRGLQLKAEVDKVEEAMREAGEKADPELATGRLALLAEEERLHEEAARIMKTLVRHRTVLQRVAWRLLPNPFREASQEEMGELFAFFLMCRMKSRIRSTMAPADRRSSTLGMASRILSGTSPRGRDRTGSRSTGGTIE